MALAWLSWTVLQFSTETASLMGKSTPATMMGTALHSLPCNGAPVQALPIFRVLTPRWALKMWLLTSGSSRFLEGRQWSQRYD